MDPIAQPASGYYVWAPPGNTLTVLLHLDVVDRILNEVMRGFGAIPKRGAEVGGILIGSVEQSGNQTMVRIDDFESVACDYRRGPSYLFSGDDGAAFEDAVARWRNLDNGRHAVGYFRSHTRDGLSLAPEDIDLMDHYFPAPANIALLIKPFATKVSMASFFFRVNALFPSTAPLEFPFRRREMTGEEAPPRRPMLERVPRVRERPQPPPPEPVSPPVFEEEAEHLDPLPAPPAYAYTAPSRSRTRTGWAWIPLSFVFLLLGVVLGFQAALTMGPRVGGLATVDYSLGLTVTREGSNLSVRWNHDAQAVKAAQKGICEIEDGGHPRPTVDLDQAQLRNGSILYTNSSGAVRFRLIVYPQDKVTVMQTVDWSDK